MFVVANHLLNCVHTRQSVPPEHPHISSGEKIARQLVGFFYACKSASQKKVRIFLSIACVLSYVYLSLLQQNNKALLQ